MSKTPDKLGDILLSQGIISQKQLEISLNIQKKTGSRLGDIIVSKGFCGYLPLYSAIADHYGLDFVNLIKTPPDKSLISRKDAELYINFRAIPWKLDNDGKIIIALSEIGEETKKFITQKFGGNVNFVITSPLDIRRTVESEFGQALEEKSRLHLWQKIPEKSARSTLSYSEKIILYFLLITFLSTIFLFPKETIATIVAFCTSIYCASLFIKIFIFIKSIPPKPAINWQEELTALDEKTLPVYTIIVAMYKEKESMQNLLSALRDIDYPVEKLDIKLALEEDDNETLQAAISLKPEYNFEIIRVPTSNLRTKPKACNYALRFARGEYVTVFDADDRPERTQLKKAIITFRSHPDIACLQARLSYYNHDKNLLTRFFELEYSLLFDFLLHGLERLGIPIPLGGTSNHISLTHLRKLGEWDPFNVTEDADLGVRLAAAGLKTRMLDSYTKEEATSTIPTWIRQRSRWIKGYMQTWLVHNRNIPKLYKTLGSTGFWGFQFFVGVASFIFLTSPLVWLLSIFWYTLPYTIPVPDWEIEFSIASLLSNFWIHWFMGFFHVREKAEESIWDLIAVIFYPFYLLLHSLASYKALCQLATKPHFWEKTMHGQNNSYSQFGDPYPNSPAQISSIS